MSPRCANCGHREYSHAGGKCRVCGCENFVAKPAPSPSEQPKSLFDTNPNFRGVEYERVVLFDNGMLYVRCPNTSAYKVFTKAEARTLAKALTAYADSE